MKSCTSVRTFLLLVLLFLVLGCAKPPNKSTTAGLSGAALGAGLGAIVGNQTGRAGEGVAIGAALGGLSGALVGNSLDAQDKRNQELDDRLRRQEAELAENRRLIEQLRKRGADVRSTERGVVVNLPDVLFNFDDASLTREADVTVREMAEVLRTVDDRVIAVEGHTDSIGTVTYNKQLSLRRARSVEDALRSNGIPEAQLRVQGFGEGSPIATNNTEAGRARNRRVEVIVENQR